MLYTAAGIDGGGTKTIVELRSSDNEIISRRSYGAFNLNSIGSNEFLSLTQAIITDLISTDCRSICIGAAGVSNPRVGMLLKEVLTSCGYKGKLKLTGDHETALAGAIGSQDGLILIAGTGSICFGQTTQGLFARSGGYGHIIDDGGSAYAIARDALSYIVKACDGRCPDTALHKALFTKLSIQAPSELVPLIYSEMDKRAVASLCPLVTAAAEAGDNAAIDIICKNVDELICLASAVYSRLELTDASICLLGGVLTGSEYIRTLTIRALKKTLPRLTPVQALADAAAGAAQIAVSMLD